MGEHNPPYFKSHFPTKIQHAEILSSQILHNKVTPDVPSAMPLDFTSIWWISEIIAEALWELPRFAVSKMVDVTPSTDEK